MSAILIDVRYSQVPEAQTSYSEITRRVQLAARLVPQIQ